MQAIEISRPGGPEALVPVELPDPVPGPGFALLYGDAVHERAVLAFQIRELESAVSAPNHAVMPRDAQVRRRESVIPFAADGEALAGH